MLAAPMAETARRIDVLQTRPRFTAADVGLRECRGVVRAVADHCDDSALRLEFAHDLNLLIRSEICADFVDAEFGTDCLSNARPVATGHDRTNATRLEGADRRGR